MPESETYGVESRIQDCIGFRFMGPNMVVIWQKNFALQTFVAEYVYTGYGFQIKEICCLLKVTVETLFLNKQVL